MEALSVLRSVQGSVEGVRNILRGDQDLHVKLKIGLEAIKYELALLSEEVKKTLAENNQGAKPQEWILQLQDLAYNIEDFIYERGRDPKSPAPVRLVKVAMVIDPRPEHLERINYFKERIKSIQTSRGNSVTTPTTPSVVVDACLPASPPTPNSVPVLQLVGMEQPKRDLTELLWAAGNGPQNKLKVVSIVGCSGVGKTTLAWQLYKDSSVKRRFLHRAWVEVLPSLQDPGKLLYSVLQQLGGPPQKEPESGWDVGSLRTQLIKFLRDKRYLVIIDGVRENDAYWAVIRPALPVNYQGSRIVVTTSIRSVATGCSSSGSYIYSMRGLDRNHSEDLFWAKLGRRERPPALVDGLQTFFDKCDGLPLLVVGTAEFLCRRHGTALTDGHCKDVGDDLRKHLAGEDPAFGKTRTSLERCCDSLPEYGHKVCMLSVSAFPKGHQINRKSLIRRWIAEGLVVGDAQQKVACEYLDKMRDLNIIEPAASHSQHAGNSTTKMKRCRVHGVILEFLVQQSVSWNFITLIKEHEVVRNDETNCSARRLSVHGGRAGEIDRRGIQSIDLSRIRSLTVCNTEYHMSLESCKLLRVLDLEGCGWLNNDHLGVICGLLYLKYLSVRDTRVSELPSAIKHLQCLETLDVRQTQVAKLPLQVLKLPQLLHLFGKFELPHQLEHASTSDNKLEKFFSEESKLQTLSGFKIVDSGGFKLLLLHLTMLRKVKIWCDEVPPSSPPPPSPASWDRVRNVFRKRRKNIVSADNLSAYLVEPLQERFVGSNALDSISVDFGGHCRDFLASALNDGYAVSSLKVCGKMDGLPQSPALRSVRHVKELQLCKTGLRISDLSRLQSLPCLVYLKLVEKEDHTDFWNGRFVVEADGFPSLLQLCFHGPRLPEVQFSPISVSPLHSLQLICPEELNNDSLRVAGIEYLQFLNEVILHPHTSPEKMNFWKLEADKNKNRPYVKKQQQNDGA